MKKLFSKLMLVAMAAMTFTACEDVPEPYGKPYEKGGGNTEIEGAKGTGTKDDPFNAIAALNYGNGLASGETSGDYYYIKGKVVSVKEEFTTQYGNGTFYISEDGTSTNQFYAYRVMYLGNKKFANGDTQIAVGDDVVVCAKITNYNGTIETVQKEGFLYELNGENRGGEPNNSSDNEGTPTGDGTLENPYNAAAAIAYCKEVGDTESPKDVYIKGKVVSITEQYGTQYGNATFTISDDGTTATTTFTVFRALYLGNKKYTAGDLLEEGADVIICGKVTNFRGNTPETVQNKAFLYSLNGKSEGGGGEEAEAKGTGTLADPYNAAAANNVAGKLANSAVSDQAYYIKGKVSRIATDKNGNVQNFDYGTYGNASFYISDDGTETGEFYCYRVLYLENAKWEQGAGDVLKVGDEVVVYAKLTNYNGTSETAQNEGYLYSLNGTTKRNGGGEQPSGEVKKVTVAEFNAAAVSNDVWYELTGKVTNLKDGDQYGNFDLVDATGSVYVYGLLSEKGGEKKKFQDLVAAKGITEGCTITIVGNRGEYNGKIEVMNAYFVSIEGGGDNPNPNPGGDVQEVTVAQFNAAAVSNDVWYQLKGKVTNLKDGDQYGNFDLVDETGSVYVYGLLAEKGGEKKKFQDLVAAKGIKENSVITIIGNRGEYNGKIEVMNAYFVSIESGSEQGGGGGGDVSGSSITINAPDFGFADKGAATSYTLSDGTKISFDKGEGSTAPAYYGGDYASVRIYAKNTITIVASKNITKVAITTTSPSGSTKYNGNDMAYAEGGNKVSINKESDTSVSFSGLNGSTVTIVNDHSEGKGGTQLRISSMTITYAK